MLRLFRQNSDGRAVSRVLAGDGDAFGLLVDRYGRAALAVARAIAPPPSDAEDVLQDAFVLAYRKLDTLEQPHRFGPWLISITRNVALRARERTRDTTPLDNAPSAALATHPSPERAEVRAVVRHALDRLDTEPREVLMLHYFAGASVADIADMLGITTAAVKKRLQRARESLGADLLRTLGKESDEALNLSARRRKKIVAAAVLGGATWHGQAHAATLATANVGTISLALKAALTLTAIGGVAAAIYLPLRNTRPAPPDTIATSSTELTRTPPRAPHATRAKKTEAPTAANTGPLPTGPGSAETFLKDFGGNPVPNATALLEKVEWKAMQVPPANVPTWTSASDAKGRVYFENLPIGEYSLIANSATLCGVEDFYLSKNHPDSHADATALMPTSRLSGRVQDATGAPIANAVLYPMGHESSPGSEVSHVATAAARTTSDADGHFEFPHLWPGKMKFFVYAPGFAPFQSAWTPTGTAPATFTLDKGTSLDLTLLREPGGAPLPNVPLTFTAQTTGRIVYNGKTAKDGTLHLDLLAPLPYDLALEDAALVLTDTFTFEPQNSTLNTLTVHAAAGATISGKVVEATTGAPLPGLVIVAQSNHEREAITADDGTYLLVGVPGGDIYIGVCGIAGISRRTYPGGIPGFEQGAATNRPITVKAGDAIEGIDFKLARATVVTGHVLDPSGNPVANAEVQATLKDCAASLGEGTKTDDTGKFTFQGLPNNCPPILFAHNEIGISALTPVTPENSTVLILTLAPNGVFLAGTAMGPDAKPILKGMVSLNYPDGLSLSADIKDGKVTFGFVPPGDVKYAIMYDSGNMSFHPCAPGDIDLHEGERHKDYKFTCGDVGGLSISGKVLLPDGKLAAGTLVTMMGMPQQSTADKLGHFKLDGLKDKDYALRAALKGYTSIDIQNANGGDTDVILQLKALGTFAGIVTDFATGAPLKAHILLDHYMLGDAEPQETDSDETGKFTIKDVMAGQGQLVTTANGYAKNRFIYPTVQPGAETTVTVQLHPPATVAGTVVTADGQPIENAQLMETVSRETRNTTTDGHFKFDSLEESVQHTFEISHPDHGIKTVQATPGAPGADELRIEMEAPPTLEVNATYNGEPLDEFQFGAYQLEPRTAPSLHEDPKKTGGHWSTHKVAPGLWQVSLTHMEAEGNMFRPAGTVSRQVEIRAGETTVFNADIVSGNASLSGQVTTPTGGAPQRLIASLLAADGSGQMMNAGISDNTYRFDKIPPGEYLLTLIVDLAPINHQLIRRITLAGSEEKTFDLALEGGASATFTHATTDTANIRITLNSGPTPLSTKPGQDLSKVSDNENFTTTLPADDNAITLPSLPPGSYWLTTRSFPNPNPLTPAISNISAPEPTIQQITIAPGENLLRVGG